MPEAVEHLATAELEVLGRITSASNATLFAVARGGGRALRCVYKPVAGERPLWDFPDRTLALREVAAYAVSAATGWDVVPPTVLREGPAGVGSVQLWVDPDGADDDAEHEVRLAEPGAGLVDLVAAGRLPEGWLPVLRASDETGRPVALVHADDERLRRVAVLDVVLNNADRKAGHVLPGPGGAVHGVDHGLTFHEDDKLRTVLWGWAGARLLDPEREVLERLEQDLQDRLGEVLAGLLAPAEVEGTLERVRRLLRRGRLPRPGQGWPAIPWPAF
ncbi:SCO1664 family protein [Kineococcus sp. NUM-3379]